MPPTVFEDGTRQFAEVLDLAQQYAKSSLGMELIEIRAKDTGFGVHHAKKPKRAKSSKKKKKKKRAANSDESEDSDEESDEESEAEDPDHAFRGGKQYILRSGFSEDVMKAACNFEDWKEEEDSAMFDLKNGDQLAHLGILQVILALILVNGRSLQDGESLISDGRLHADLTEQIHFA